MKINFKNKKFIIIGIIFVLLIGISISIYKMYPSAPEEYIRESANMNDNDFNNYLDKLYPKNKILFSDKTDEYRKELITYRTNEISYLKHKDSESVQRKSVKVKGVKIENVNNDSKVIINLKNNGNQSIKSVKLNLWFFTKNKEVYKLEELKKEISIRIGETKTVDMVVDSKGWDNVTAEFVSCD